MRMPVTEYLKRTAELADFTYQLLENSEMWHTYLLGCGGTGTNIMKTFPALRLPAAVIHIPGITFGSNPRRTVLIDITVCTGKFSNVSLPDLADSITGLLDGTATGDAVFHIQSIAPAEADPAVQALLLRFQVNEH